MPAGDEVGEGLPRAAEPVEDAVDDRRDAVTGDERDIALELGAAPDKDPVEADPAHQDSRKIGRPAAGRRDAKQCNEAAVTRRPNRLVESLGAADVEYGVDPATAPSANLLGPALAAVIHRKVRAEGRDLRELVVRGRGHRDAGAKCLGDAESHHADPAGA